MKINLTNPNYCATVVEIKDLIDLDNCDNVRGAHIFGQHVIVDKLTVIGDVGLFFPVESALGKDFLAHNNLYRDSALNRDTTRNGYFEAHGRVRCVKFRGHKSQGLFLPISCLDGFGDGVTVEIGDSFNYIGEKLVADKYVPKFASRANSASGKKQAKVQRESRIIPYQFRFHDDTAQLYRNLHRFHADTPISITYKLHGTSAVFSRVLVKKKLRWWENALRRLGVDVVDREYDMLYSSRKIVKNGFFEESQNSAKANGGYYGEDLWGQAAKLVEPHLTDGLSVYAEIVGFTPSGKAIQKGYDYGCAQNQFEIYVYRVTYTSPCGDVHEFSTSQMIDWCKSVGMRHVPLEWSGMASWLVEGDTPVGEKLLEQIAETWLDKPCYMCNNNVPAEGVVVRIEGREWEAYKCKSDAFYERETKLLDKGEVDMESEETVGNE